MHHKLKIQSTYAIDLYHGNKTFEIRKNDRNYQIGDTIEFEVIDNPNLKLRTYIVTYVLKDCKEHGLEPGFAILSIQLLSGGELK